MAKRAALTFDAMKVAKGAAAEAPAPVAAVQAPAPEAEKRGRGRPAKRPEGVKLYGMTLRIPSNLRRALRRLADDETDARGGDVVSIHDLILEAVGSHLASKGVKVEP